MTDDACVVLAVLDAWRADGHDRVLPVRFRVIEALARRAARCDGALRRRLDARLATLLDAYAVSISATVAAQAAALDAAADRADDLAVAARGDLASLLDALAGRPAAGLRWTPVDSARYVADRLAGDVPQVGHTPRRDSPACALELPVLDYFRSVWTRVNATRQLRRARERVPDNAGPLNSGSLVHRSLTLMRELSPAYFEQFLSYADALAWLEPLVAPAAGAQQDGVSPPGKPARGRARTRQR